MGERTFRSSPIFFSEINNDYCEVMLKKYGLLAFFASTRVIEMPIIV